MKHRRFGGDSALVSEVGLGAWQLGGDWGEIEESTAMDILKTAVDQGVNFIDTADVYGLGRSETLIGRFLRDCGEPLFAATKLGRFPDPGWPRNFTLETFRAHTEASLRRLGVEALDLTQLHCIPTELMERGEVFQWLRILKREGKIKRFGASVESMDEALMCLEQDGLASLQIIFNIFRQKPADVLFEKAREKGVALIVRLPLASGLLSGKYTRETFFPENDHRNYNRDGEKFNVGETFAGLTFEQGLAAADRLRPLTPAHMDMAQMAIRWILDHEAVSTVIPGARKTSQVLLNCAASDAPPLPGEVHRELRAIYETEVKPHIRGPY